MAISAKRWKLSNSAIMTLSIMFWKFLDQRHQALKLLMNKLQYNIIYQLITIYKYYEVYIYSRQKSERRGADKLIRK